MNLRKHGIDFRDAAELFDQPHLEGPDERGHEGEHRWIVYGELNGHVLALVYTWRGTTRRIISARKATRNEREAYYKAIHSN